MLCYCISSFCSQPEFVWLGPCMVESCLVFWRWFITGFSPTNRYCSSSLSNRRSVRMNWRKGRFLVIPFQCSRTLQEVLQRKWCTYSWALQNSQNIYYTSRWFSYTVKSVSDICCSAGAMDNNVFFYWNVTDLFLY